MLLAGTCGVIIGGPVALWVCLRILPESMGTSAGIICMHLLKWVAGPHVPVLM